MRLSDVKGSDDVMFSRTFVGGHFGKGERGDNFVLAILLPSSQFGIPSIISLFLSLFIFTFKERSQYNCNE